MRRFLSLLCLATASFTMTACADSSADSPKPAASVPPPAHTETLVLGGGCFWCVEAAYELVPGVLTAESGYAGGARPNPTYEQVCTGATGHAEIVKLTFDPAQVTRAQLVDFFWEIHDPTTLNRQGADVGTQYRSVIYYADEAEKTLILASRDRANASLWNGKIVTEISALPTVYIAEDYHQDYYRKNPSAGYCRAVIKPKIDKLKKSPLVQPASGS
ncbi:MAG: peptide-methionine (S)-S-oxide reductase MsrA [Opitutaceae bacterium]|jgi:peptide-methionine (S)-S-oxide reductase|nr:peptide-methionine (S)-S-oxide reductase MsrA [Opitutaceae bacterium]